MHDWESCQKSLGLSFGNESLLRQALTHSSYINEHPDSILPSNERLEFLGDAILDFIVAEKLYQEFPQLPEGKLTAIRASLVCRDALVEIASSLKLDDYLLLGQGEEASGGRIKPSNLANVMEAVIGAVYLDQGLAKTKRFVLSQLEPRLKKIKTEGITLNYKALLQEFIQGKKKLTPVYQLVEATGPDHARQFTVAVTVEDEVLGKGRGKNKKAAETEAARSAWEKISKKEDVLTTSDN
jgi:ribonuclease-3